MANFPEWSSSLSNASSSNISNGSSNSLPPFPAATGPTGCSTCSSSEPRDCMETVSLSRLSLNLERLLSFKEFDSTDAEIEVEGTIIGVHRAILAVRSDFFCRLFSEGTRQSNSRGAVLVKPKYSLSDLIPTGHVGREALEEVLWYLYTGRLKTPDPSVYTCVADVDCCTHDACRPAINYAIELMYASHTFQIEELISLLQRHLLDFVEKALVEDVIPILLISIHARLSQLTFNCIQRVVCSDLDEIILQKELPCDLAGKIISERAKCPEYSEPPFNPDTIRGVSKIRRALDCDDIELVKMLLKESDRVTLDDANALHYATAYCDPKIVSEILKLGLADVNLKNGRGFTPLHIAAMRKEPAVIVALLRKGASPSACANDGRHAVSICKRLTRPKDYYARTENGKESNKGRICIDILEREFLRESRNSMTREESVVSHAAVNNLQQELLYYENRVALAKILFPTEARVAMQVAETMSNYNLCGKKGSLGNLKELDPNESPSSREEKLQLKLEAFRKTVENGRHYFPHCSEVLDKWMNDEHTIDLSSIEQSVDELDIKRRRFDEIKEDVLNAFHKDIRKDKADKRFSALSSPGSRSGRKHSKLR